jgi:hypothetical protein
LAQYFAFDSLFKAPLAGSSTGEAASSSLKREQEVRARKYPARFNPTGASRATIGLDNSSEAVPVKET